MTKLHIATLLAVIALGLSAWGMIKYLDTIHQDTFEWVNETDVSTLYKKLTTGIVVSHSLQFTPDLIRAMHLVETDGDCSLIGDTNTPYPAYGCFQIRIGIHPGVTRACAEDYQCASAYLVKFLTAEQKRLGLSDDDTIRRWNGLPANRSNLGYVVSVRNKM